jgi:hypothetical protein
MGRYPGGGGCDGAYRSTCPPNAVLDGKLKADVILRPSPGSMAKKRWILNGSWERLTIARKPRDGSGMTADMLKEVLDDGAETILE